MTIPKLPQKLDSFKRPYAYFDNARLAWSQILIHYKTLNSELVVILPAYIGYSVNEGSGIFDFIRANNVKYDFYDLSADLAIDVGDLKTKVKRHRENALVLLVHYFGFPDINYNHICDWLINENIQFTEDCAHAMLSDFVGGSCGRRCKFAFYSLHKLVPSNYGGLLVMNQEKIDIDEQHFSRSEPINIFEYDLKEIYNRRRYNFEYLSTLISNFDGIDLLHPNLPKGVGPQTLPVIVNSNNRDFIYFKMNELGFGFVSLYHTMIDELKNTNFASAKYTSKHITNLPIHQDCNRKQLQDMARSFQEHLIAV